MLNFGGCTIKTSEKNRLKRLKELVHDDMITYLWMVFHAVGVERNHWDGRFGRISQGPHTWDENKKWIWNHHLENLFKMFQKLIDSYMGTYLSLYINRTTNFHPSNQAHLNSSLSSCTLHNRSCPVRHQSASALSEIRGEEKNREVFWFQQ